MRIAKFRQPEPEASPRAPELISKLSHDIRNPLTVILASAVLLRRLPGDSLNASVVQKTARDIEAMTVRITALLEAATAEAKADEKKS